VNTITLIGMPGSGKSTVGVLLAKALGKDFIDTDLILQQRYGALLQDILDRMGLEAFLDAEADAIRSLTPASCVISPGGSCVCRAAAMEHLNTLGPVIYLRLTLDTLTQRLDNIQTRGIAMSPGQTLKELYEYRAPLYERYADMTVTSDGQTLEQTVSAVLLALQHFKKE